MASFQLRSNGGRTTPRGGQRVAPETIIQAFRAALWKLGAEGVAGVSLTHGRTTLALAEPEPAPPQPRGAKKVPSM